MNSLAVKAHFNNYSPSTFGWKFETIPPLVPLEFDGVNFGQCAKAAHGLFVAFLTELVPHIPGGLITGKCWGFSATDDLPDGSWSFHHYGLAVDINWSVNPMGTYSTNPNTGTGVIPHRIASDIARKYGMEYGGDWSGGDGHNGFKDYMHFEIHLSPADAASVTAKPAADDPNWSDMATQAEIQALIDASIDKHLRAAVFGGNAKLNKDAPGLYPDAGHGLTDRLSKLEKAAQS